jgi:hypothetical protein
MRRGIVLLIVCLLACAPVAAHVLNYELDQQPQGSIFWKYLCLGYEHIIPLGFDHILFILCIFFLNTSIRKIILQATMFTLAHSITLGLSMYGIINPDPRIVEPLIALSIVILALENVFSGKVKPWRLLTIFLFGMVHGMGFAGALGSLGMPHYAFATALVAFNAGVELGQLSIILFMYFVVARTMSSLPWYRKSIVIPVSLTIAGVALYWTVQRTFFPGLL